MIGVNCSSPGGDEDAHIIIYITQDSEQVANITQGEYENLGPGKSIHILTGVGCKEADFTYETGATSQTLAQQVKLGLNEGQAIDCSGSNDTTERDLIIGLGTTGGAVLVAFIVLLALYIHMRRSRGYTAVLQG